MDRERIKQPVTAIRACAQFALLKLARSGERDNAGIGPYLETIVAETRRLEALLVEPTNVLGTDLLLDVLPSRHGVDISCRRSLPPISADAVARYTPATAAMFNQPTRHAVNWLAPQVVQQLHLASRRLGWYGDITRGPRLSDAPLDVPATLICNGPTPPHA